MAPRDIGGPLAIELELMRERASGLKRVATKLEALIGRLEAIRTQLPTAPLRDSARLKTEYVQVRAEAEKQRWYLIVQREAMGLNHHHDIDMLYAIPGPIDR